MAKSYSSNYHFFNLQNKRVRKNMKEKELETEPIKKWYNKYAWEIWPIPIVFIISLFVLVVPKINLSFDVLKPKSELKNGSSLVSFRGVDFYIHKVDRKKEKLQLWLRDDNGDIYKNIGKLKKDIEQKGEEELLFAMNAGMYTPKNLPQGLYKSGNRLESKLDVDTSGYGNFYMQPNGVFAFNKTDAIIKTTKEFSKKVKKFSNATQSGPMLVIEGKIHPKFNEPSTSKYIRNGVGIDDDENIVFAYSTQPVNLYHFADLFKTYLACDNALYLDGAISKVYVPALSKYDLSGNLGPLIGTTIRKKKGTTAQKKSVSKVDENFERFIFQSSKNNLSIISFNKAQYDNYIGIEDFEDTEFQMFTNGGSFKKNLLPEGLLIQDYNVISDINLDEGEGNFYLKPNGILFKKSKKFEIKESINFLEELKFEIKNEDSTVVHKVKESENLFRIGKEYGVKVKDIKKDNGLKSKTLRKGQELKIVLKQVEKENNTKSSNIEFAVQSGPLLINDGEIHSAFRKESSNKKVRNGVGISQNGDVIFLLSKKPINLFSFAKTFREDYNCDFALCLDSGISMMCTDKNKKECFDLISKRNYGYFIAVD